MVKHRVRAEWRRKPHRPGPACLRGRVQVVGKYPWTRTTNYVTDAILNLRTCRVRLQAGRVRIKDDVANLALTGSQSQVGSFYW